MRKKKISDNLAEIGQSLNSWYEKYLEDGIFDDEKKGKLLDEYKKLSQEGVQKKANRQKRFEILKEYIGF